MSPLGAREVIVVEPVRCGRASSRTSSGCRRRRAAAALSSSSSSAPCSRRSLPVAARLEALASRPRGRRGPCRGARDRGGTGARSASPVRTARTMPARVGAHARRRGRRAAARPRASCPDCRSRRPRRGAEGPPSWREARRWRGRWERSPAGAARARSAGARRAARSATSRAPPAASAIAQSHAPQRRVQRTKDLERGPGEPISTLTEGPAGREVRPSRRRRTRPRRRRPGRCPSLP